MELYNKLRKEHYMYCQGKSPKVLKAACRYIEGIIGKDSYKNQQEICFEYNLSEASLRKRFREIAKLFKIKKIKWGTKITCDFCGKKFLSNTNSKFKFSNSIHICYKCRRSLAWRIYNKWRKASICICCGEINPLFLLPSGHHIFGRSNSNITIPICANCHELTKPRSRQSFFLFDGIFPLKKSKFTEDNSKLYIHID